MPLAPDGAGGAAPVAVADGCEGVGCMLWQQTYNGPGAKHDRAVDVLADADRAFVTGWHESGFLRDDIVTAAFDRASGAELWRAMLDGTASGVDRPAALAMAGGLLVVVGETEGATTGADALLVAYDAATGAEAWRTSLDGSAGSHDRARAVAVSADGARVFVAGEATGAISQSDAFVAAVDAASGATLWRVQMDGGARGADELTDLALRADGTLVASGVAGGATTDVWALSLDADGALLWSATHDTGRDDRANAIAVDASGRAYLAGKVAAASGFDNYLTVAFDAAGAEMWNATYNGPSNWFDVAHDVVVAPTGIVFVSGESHSSTNADYTTLGYNATGDLVSTHRFNHVANNADRAREAVLSADGAVLYLAGESWQSGVSYDMEVVAVSTADSTTLWTSRHNGPANSDDKGVAIALAPDGSVVAAATSRGSGTNDDLLAVEVGSGGALAWSARVNGPASTEDVGSDVVVSPDGATAYVTGRSWASGSNLDVLLLAYDVATGATIWESRYNAPSNSVDEGEAMALSADGTRLFVTGRSIGTGYDYLTLAVDAADGSVVWSARYNGVGSGNDFPGGIAVGGGLVYVTGQSWGGSTTRYDYATVAYDAATGAQLWVARESGPVAGDDAARALVLSPDGTRLAVTGQMPRGAGFGIDYATYAYDAASGSALWSATYNHAGSTDEAHLVAFSPDGASLYVSGRSVGSGFDIATLAYDAGSGAQQWLSRYSASGLSDEAWAMAVSPDGARVALTGVSWGGSSGYDLFTLAYESTTGAMAWSTRTVGPSGTDLGQNLAYAPDGTRLYAAGYSSGGGTGDDWLVVAYAAADGEPLWGARLNGAGDQHDYANGLAVTPDGTRLVVTGRAHGSGTYLDAHTVAFAALAVPGAPQDLAATAGPGLQEVSLSWSPPADDGGSPVTGYRVYMDGALVETLPASASGTTVATPDTAARTFAVAAVNVAGEGAAATIVAAPFQGPGAPEDVNATPHGLAGEVLVSWAAPAWDGGSPLTAYHVERLDGEAWTRIATLPPSNTTHVDAELTPLTTYRYRVVAENAVGEGAPSAEACSVASPWPDALPPCGAPLEAHA